MAAAGGPSRDDAAAADNAAMEEGGQVSLPLEIVYALLRHDR